MIRLQVEVAVEEADLLLFMVDGREGLNPLDEYVADFLRRFQKDTLLIANKVDDYTKQEQIMEFYGLGFGQPIWFSCLHGLNMDDLLTGIHDFFESKPDADEQEIDDATKLAIVGQPNVGKSSLLNRFLSTDRVMVNNNMVQRETPWKLHLPSRIKNSC